MNFTWEDSLLVSLIAACVIPFLFNTLCKKQEVTWPSVAALALGCLLGLIIIFNPQSIKFKIAGVEIDLKKEVQIKRVFEELLWDHEQKEHRSADLPKKSQSKFYAKKQVTTKKKLKDLFIKTYGEKEGKDLFKYYKKTTQELINKDSSE